MVLVSGRGSSSYRIRFGDTYGYGFTVLCSLLLGEVNVLVLGEAVLIFGGVERRVLLSGWLVGCWLKKQLM